MSATTPRPKVQEHVRSRGRFGVRARGGGSRRVPVSVRVGYAVWVRVNR